MKFTRCWKYVRVALLSLVTMAGLAQNTLPDSVRDRCDNILVTELGQDLYDQCISFVGFEQNDPARPGRQDYFVTYAFTFPDMDGAVIDLPFACAVYNGQVRVQSGYFLRTNQSDLPARFSDKGTEIIGLEQAMETACVADTTLITQMNQVEGRLVLTQTRLLWCFAYYDTVPNPNGDAEEVVAHVVWVDPYTGEVDMR